MTFEYTRMFGPLIKMIEVMIKDMLTFMILWCLILVFFLCVGILIFVDTPEFLTFQSSLVFLS
jgi:hypothetical protein